MSMASKPEKPDGPHKVTKKAAAPALAGKKQAAPGAKGQWKPGQSGNPRGKAPGQSVVTKLRASIAEHVPAIVNQLVRAAQGGDVQAARLLLERVLPPVRPVEQPQAMDLPDGDLAEKGLAVLGAAAKGVLSPTQAAALIGAIGTLARVAEIDQLERRMKALEHIHGKP